MDCGERTRCLRERISRPSAAVLRVSASLDLNTVLQEVVEGARALTGTRYGAITTIDARGQDREFVSSGLTSEQHRQLAEWPDGPRLFKHLRDLAAPLRLHDVRAHVRSLGFLLRPACRRACRERRCATGARTSETFFLGDKEGGEEFTREDEEALLLFAAQAATAIAKPAPTATRSGPALTGGADRDLACGRRSLRGHSHGGLDQSGSAADCRQPEHAEPLVQPTWNALDPALVIPGRGVNSASAQPGSSRSPKPVSGSSLN